MFRCLLPKNEILCQQAVITAMQTSQCLCQVSLGLKEIQMGDHDFKLKQVHLYAQKPVNINFLSSDDPKLALVPASRCDCHV